MRTLVALSVAAAASLSLASPAMAVTVLSEDFEGEGPALNYAAFAQFTVSNGTVDVVQTPGFGITCAGGAGRCVDLDGSTANGGRLTSINSFAFNAGDLVLLSFAMGGSQRGQAEGAAGGFIFAAPTTMNNVTVIDTGPPALFGTQGPTTSAQFGFGPYGSSVLPLPRSYSFVAGNAGTLQIFFESGSNDNVGAILDDVQLDISAAVPEPTTWAMMIFGFGAIGGALRSSRRRRPARTATLA